MSEQSEQSELASGDAKHPGGRPTKYDPAFCEMVIEWGKQGKSKAWICAELEVVDQTLRNWTEAHPEFLEAMELAHKKSQQWWEDRGQVGMQGKTIDGSIWSRSMAARFPNDWREKTETKNEHSGPGGGAIPHEHVVEVRRTIVGPGS
jgi:hypothetical protein